MLQFYMNINMCIHAKAGFVFIYCIFSTVVGNLVCCAIPATRHYPKNCNRCGFSCCRRSLFLAECDSIGERSSYKISALFESSLSLAKIHKLEPQMNADSYGIYRRLSAVKVDLFAENLQANRALSISEINFDFFSGKTVQAS